MARANQEEMHRWRPFRITQFHESAPHIARDADADRPALRASLHVQDRAALGRRHSASSSRSGGAQLGRSLLACSISFRIRPITSIGPLLAPVTSMLDNFA